MQEHINQICQIKEKAMKHFQPLKAQSCEKTKSVNYQKKKKPVRFQPNFKLTANILQVEGYKAFKKKLNALENKCLQKLSCHEWKYVFYEHRDLEKSAVSSLSSAVPAVLDIFWSDPLNSVTGCLLHEFLDEKRATSSSQVGEAGSRPSQ